MQFRMTLFLAAVAAVSAAELRGTQSVRLLEEGDDDGYVGCLCACTLPDGAEGVLIHTVSTAVQAEGQIPGQEEKVEASHVLCVDDMLSIEFVNEGRGTCDEECFL